MCDLVVRELVVRLKPDPSLRDPAMDRDIHYSYFVRTRPEANGAPTPT